MYCMIKHLVRACSGQLDVWFGFGHEMRVYQGVSSINTDDMRDGDTLGYVTRIKFLFTKS
jgi:hypothetical protein